MIAVSATTTYLMRRVGYRWPMGIGFALMAIGFGLTALAPPWDTQPYAWLATSSAITGIGMGVSIPASNVAAIQLAPESAAAISGLRGMTRQTGGIVSISVVSAVAAASSAPGHVQAVGFLVFVPLLLALVPLQRFVPDNRGS
jgi:MFS family permease